MLRYLSIIAIVLCAALGAGMLFAPEGQTQGSVSLGLPAGEGDLGADVAMIAAPETGSLADTSPVMAQAAPGGVPEAMTVSAGRLTSLLGLRRAESGAGAGDQASLSACTPALTLSAETRAMIAVDYHAPCLAAGAEVVLRHGPLVLHERLDADGRLRIVLPALAPQALVAVTPPPLAGREMPETVSELAVPAFAAQTRLVASWAGPSEVALHAFVDGADWGAAGHVRQASAPADGAFLTALGSDTGGRSLVLTFPAGIAPHEGRIEVEAEIALGTKGCGRSLALDLLLVQPGAPVSRVALAFDMPDCGGPAGFVSLGDLLQHFAPEPPTGLAPSAPGLAAPLPAQSGGDTLGLAALARQAPELR